MSPDLSLPAAPLLLLWWNIKRGKHHNSLDTHENIFLIISINIHLLSGKEKR
jgi:hypothetical protein